MYREIVDEVEQNRGEAKGIVLVWPCREANQVELQSVHAPGLVWAKTHSTRSMIDLQWVADLP